MGGEEKLVFTSPEAMRQVMTNAALVPAGLEADFGRWVGDC